RLLFTFYVLFLVTFYSLVLITFYSSLLSRCGRGLLLGELQSHRLLDKGPQARALVLRQEPQGFLDQLCTFSNLMIVGRCTFLRNRQKLLSFLGSQGLERFGVEGIHLVLFLDGQELLSFPREVHPPAGSGKALLL